MVHCRKSVCKDSQEISTVKVSAGNRALAAMIMTPTLTDSTQQHFYTIIKNRLLVFDSFCSFDLVSFARSADPEAHLADYSLMTDRTFSVYLYLC